MLTLLAQLNRLHTCSSIMAEHLDPNDLVTIEELGISNMWETSALVEVLEGKRSFHAKQVDNATQGLRFLLLHSRRTVLPRPASHH